MRCSQSYLSRTLSWLLSFGPPPLPPTSASLAPVSPCPLSSSLVSGQRTTFQSRVPSRSTTLTTLGAGFLPALAYPADRPLHPRAHAYHTRPWSCFPLSHRFYFPLSLSQLQILARIPHVSPIHISRPISSSHVVGPTSLLTDPPRSLLSPSPIARRRSSSSGRCPILARRLPLKRIVSDAQTLHASVYLIRLVNRPRMARRARVPWEEGRLARTRGE